MTRSQQAAVSAEAVVALKTNRYDAATDTLRLTAAQAEAYRREIAYWTDYFRHPVRNGGLKADLVTDPTELRQFTAFVSWAAWASVAERPGARYSYTNNFPYDPTVGNLPTPDALLWSALSLIVLLAGIAAVLLVFGKFDSLGWITRGHHVHPQMLPGPERAREILRRRDTAVPRADTGRQRRRSLPRGSGELLRLRPVDDPSEQPAADLASAAGDLLDRDCLCRGGAVPRAFARHRRAALVRRLGARAVRRVRRGDRREPAGGMDGHRPVARRPVVLVRQSRLGVPRTRPRVAVPAGRGTPPVVRAALETGEARLVGRAGVKADRLDVPGRGAGDPGVLRPGAVLWGPHPLHDRRYVALLDHPPVGRRLLRVLRHDHRRVDLLPTRADPPQCRTARDLSRRDPVLRRRVDRDRSPLVLHRTQQREHGDVGHVFGARGRTANLADTRRLGLRANYAGPMRRLRQDDGDPAQVGLLFPDGGGILEFCRCRHLRFPDQPADRQLLRSARC